MYYKTPTTPSQTELAVTHYFWGNGEPADVGDEATAMLMNTPIFKTNLKTATTEYLESGHFTVDMTGLVFHIGRTPVNYAVHHGVKSSHVDFHLFQYSNGKMDSFSDLWILVLRFQGEQNMIINREQLHSTLSL